jgi:hypothetical protein
MTNGWGKRIEEALERAKAIGSHSDLRFTVEGNPSQEIVCKWNAAANDFVCRVVEKGGDWSF